MDTNNDGVVDALEFAAAGGSKQEFDKLDLNGDDGDGQSKIVGWVKIAKTVLLAFTPSILVVFSGALFFMRENELSFTDAVYFACVSQTTVGFGDISPVTDNGR